MADFSQKTDFPVNGLSPDQPRPTPTVVEVPVNEVPVVEVPVNEVPVVEVPVNEVPVV